MFSPIVFPDEQIDISLEKETKKDHEKETLFRIRFGNGVCPHPNYFSLLRSVNAFFHNKEKEKDVQNVLYFRAFSVERFIYFLNSPLVYANSYSLSLQLIYFFTKQLRFLQEKENKSFYTLDPTKFVIIDRRILCYLSMEHLKEIRTEDQSLQIFSMLEKSSYLCPISFSSVSYLPPYFVSTKCIYYSLGKLILFLFFNNDIQQIQGTKLMGFLSRCMDTNLQTRQLLFL